MGKLGQLDLFWLDLFFFFLLDLFMGKLEQLDLFWLDLNDQYAK
jgi:hypothetical protein